MARRLLLIVNVVTLLGVAAVARGCGNVVPTIPDMGAAGVGESGSNSVPDASQSTAGNGGSAGDTGAGGDSAAGALDATMADAPVSQEAAVIDAGTPWTPRTLGTRLVVWLDSQTDIVVASGKVTRWKDQSGKGNDAVQDNSAKAPVLLADAGTHGAVRFNIKNSLNGISMTIADNASLQWGLGDYTIAVVAEYTNDVVPAPGNYGYAALWEKAAQPLPYKGVLMFVNAISTSPLSTGLNAQVQGGPVDGGVAVYGAKQGLNDGHYHTFVVRRTGQVTLEVRADGQSTTAMILAADVSAPGEAVGIGANHVGGQWLYGSIAELVAVSGTVSDVEMASLEAYLKEHHAL